MGCFVCFLKETNHVESSSDGDDLIFFQSLFFFRTSFITPLSIHGGLDRRFTFFMRSLTWVRNVGPRCLGTKNYLNLSGSCNKAHTKKAEQEIIKGERGVNLDTFVWPTSS